MTRRTKLTPERKDMMVRVVRGGGLYETAAALAGVHNSTLWNWMNRGEAVQQRMIEDEDYEPDEDDKAYLDFFEAITYARAEIETVSLSNIIRAGTQGVKYTTTYSNKQGEIVSHETIVPPDARHLEWFLERSMWKKYGRRNAVELTGEGGGPLQVQSAVVSSVEDYRALIQAMSEAELPLPIIDAEVLEEA